MRYTLKNEKLTASFDTFGGELVSVKDKDGIEYIWHGDKTYWGGHAPVLFPIVGSIRNKTATVGKTGTCNMERHGLVRKKEFVMEGKTENTISFSICADAEMKERFPYPFKLTVVYTLNECGITEKYTVANNGNETMPYQIGGHPGFNCPLAAGEKFEDYVVEFEKAETADCPTPVPATGLVDVSKRTRILDNTNTLKLDHSLFKVDALIFDSLKSRKAKLYNPKTMRGVELDFAQFPDLLVWSSSNDGPFVALEPWHGLSTCSDEGNVFEQKRGIKLLGAGGSDSISFSMTFLMK